MRSPTSNTLKLLRQAGYACQVVEYYQSFSKRRIDLFGFIDIIAIDGETTIGIQATSRSNRTARATKIEAIPEAQVWCSAPGRQLWLVTWAKRKRIDARGVQRLLWVSYIDVLTFQDGALVVSPLDTIATANALAK